MLLTKPFLACFALALMLALTSCNSDYKSERIFISGTVLEPESDKLVLHAVDTLKTYPLDSVKFKKDGSFAFRISVEDAGFYFLRCEKLTSDVFPAFQGDSIEIILSDCHKNKIRGGLEAGNYSAFLESLTRSKIQMDSLSKVLLDSRYKPDFAGLKSDIDSSFQLIVNELRNEAMLFIDTHPTYLSNLLIINANPGRIPLFEESTDYPHFFRVDSLLQIHHKNNRHTAFFYSRVNRLKRRIEAEKKASQNLGQGSYAPEIKLPATSGKEVSLKQQVGKYTLIYFWAPTDALSRKSNAELKLLYEKYSKLGFSVFAVSFDPLSDRFIGAVNLDKLWWTNVNDTRGLNSPLLTEYQISGFPAFIVIDAEGKIVDRFLSVKALSNWLVNNL
ncbi:MAG: AhpC/TSA family protein [Lentimicrobium sp.]|nr:AhpC/TSA family protein [Lentimicrobium sp.]